MTAGLSLGKVMTEAAMRLHSSPLAALLLALLLTACAGPVRTSETLESGAEKDPADPAAVLPRESYRLRARDFVRIGVINENDTFVERRINTDGTIDVPFLKEDSLVKISGMTMTEAQVELAKRFGAYFKSPQVSVEIKGYAERRVYIDGSVGRTGPVAIPPEEDITLKKALAMAGGILRGGNRSAVILRRKQPDGSVRTFEINVSKIEEGAEPDVLLEDDDQVFVRESRI